MKLLYILNKMINDFDCSKDSERTYKCCMFESLLYFLNMRSLPVEIRTIVHYYFFPLCQAVSCGGVLHNEKLKRGVGGQGFCIKLIDFKRKKSWFIWIMIYAQGGGLLKASVTHLSLGLEGFFLCLFIVLICSVVSLPHRLHLISHLSCFLHTVHRHAVYS